MKLLKGAGLLVFREGRAGRRRAQCRAELAARRTGKVTDPQGLVEAVEGNAHRPVCGPDIIDVRCQRVQDRQHRGRRWNERFNVIENRFHRVPVASHCSLCDTPVDCQ